MKTEITGKIKFNVDEVLHITGHYGKKTNLVFYPAKPSVQMYKWKWLENIYPFSPIPCGKTDALPDRWSTPENENNLSYYTKENLEMYHYNLDEENKIVWTKPYVFIQFLNGKTHSLYCRDNKEIDQILDSMRFSKNPFSTVLID